MRFPRIVITGAAIATFAFIGTARSQPADADGVLRFLRAAEAYTFMHRQIERRLPAMEVNANPETIRRAIDAMTAAVRAARPDARQGDLFNPALQAAIRVRIARALRSHGFTPEDVLARELAEGVDPGAVTLRVNGGFPWVIGTAMFPCVMEALPPLPPELQYRIVGRDLVLIDVHASLIVDILPFALGQSTTTSEFVTTSIGGGVLPEPHFLTRAIDFATRTAGDGSGEKSGFYPEFGSMITGAGWISGGAGYRRWIDGDRMVLDASAAISWRSYKMAHASFEFTNLLRSRLALGTEVRWQDYTQNSFFGTGASSTETGRSEYRLKSLEAVAFTNLRPTQWLTVGANGGWLQRPTIDLPAGTFQRGIPATRDNFPAEPAFALAEQPSYVHSEMSVTADTRDHRSHPLHGGVYRGAWTRYWARDHAAFSFQRFEAEGAHFVPLASSRLTLALRGWVAATDTAEGALVPFYLMPSLGGSNTLRAYANYRFHDRHLAVVNVETRLALMTHVDLAVFADAGNVAARLADLNFDKTSFGVGLRLHTEKATFGRLDVAHGKEGWRVMFNTSDPLHLSRLSRRTAAVPFVP